MSKHASASGLVWPVKGRPKWIIGAMLVVMLGGCAQGTDEPFPKVGRIPPKPTDFLTPAAQARQKAALAKLRGEHVMKTQKSIDTVSDKLRANRLKRKQN